jgi:hypothetical protein
MSLSAYGPADYDRLQPVAERLGPTVAFIHRPFVDHFYTTWGGSRLYLFTLPDGSIGGTLGLVSLRFESGGEELLIGSPSNYYSFHPGAGGYLFLHWMKTFKIGMVFGGSESTHRILGQQRWIYYPGVKVYFLNRAYPRQSGDSHWKAAAKWLMERTRHCLSRFARRMRGASPDGLAVREEQTYAEDLFPHRSPFTFRFAPRVDYLAWRYDMRLSYRRYRLFRILRGRITAGYVILNDQPERLLVAHCDGEDPVELAYGIALSVAVAGSDDQIPREVMLTSCHPIMQAVFKKLGFREARQERPFVLGSLRHRDLLPPADTSNWLINFDIGDNGLRPPFLDQQFV